ncbi:30S ribosomal protein S19e [Candidatus Woesearchaeota archaeon]|nr:30S ribosomal protein S19e [Candidatus Woesearchaeota archaeon]MBW3013951.1 30S ribosomal protein S19e [Candidatus Woesearchaeota archaeon]
MVTVFDTNPNALIDKAAEELKKIPEIKAPEWATFVKTSPGKNKPPVRDDWWYVRAAAVLRVIYIKGPIGTEKLRTKFGARHYRSKSRKPEKFTRASGSIIRKILQQLQAADLVELEDKAIKRGRRISGKGRKLMDSVAKQVAPEAKAKKLKEPELQPSVEEASVEEAVNTEEEIPEELEPAEGQE